VDPEEAFSIKGSIDLKQYKKKKKKKVGLKTNKDTMKT
jgi:hypothetical protein